MESKNTRPRKTVEENKKLNFNTEELLRKLKILELKNKSIRK